VNPEPEVRGKHRPAGCGRPEQKVGGKHEPVASGGPEPEVGGNREPAGCDRPEPDVRGYPGPDGTGLPQRGAAVPDAGEGSFAELAALVLSCPPRLGPVRLVAIDGPSGAGKTSFADRLARELGAPVVHTDDLLDGWDDQFTFWARLEEQVLDPLRHGRAAVYERYLWHRGRFGGKPVTVQPAPVVLLEGVTSARRVIRPELSLVVFVQAPPGLRLARALRREGGDDVAFRAYLERWRSAEDRHFVDDRTAAAADEVVDGSQQGPLDRYARLRRVPL
jgi:uridine kinase